jgi:hypothetical protein
MKPVTAASLAFTLLMASAPASAADAAAPPATAQTRPAAPFVPADFVVPTTVEGAGFKLSPLGPDKVKIDYDAYMSSIEHLQKTFSRSTGWPTKDITAADAMKDMENEQARFAERRSFAYAVLTPDGKRERGSVYVSPSPVPGYDAMVRLWVTKADHDAGFDAKLYAWVRNWVASDWPFAKVACPGREIDWTTWDAKVAAEKARKGM